MKLILSLLRLTRGFGRAGGPVSGSSYTPALKFNDARNSQYVGTMIGGV